MNLIFLSFIVLFFSTAFSLLFFYFQIPFHYIYSLIVILIIALLFLQKKISEPLKNRKDFYFLLLLACSSTLVLLLVFVTGGVYSSFFILLHFYAFAIGIFFSLITSLVFIVLSIFGLGAQAYIDSRLQGLFQNDPGSLALYFFSYLIIVPFSYFLAQQYQIKSKITKLLEKEAQVNNIILGSINELIIITNLDYKVLSANDAVGQLLSISRYELVGKTLFDALFLRNGNGGIITVQSLNIHEIISQNLPKTYTGLLLYAKNRAPLQINLLVKPIPDLQGNVDQLTFILTDIQTPRQVNNLELSARELQTRQQALLESFKDKLIEGKMGVLASEIYFMQNLSKDILLASEMKDLTLQAKETSTIDVAQFSNSIVIQHQEFAHLLNVLLSFRLENFTYEDIAAHVPQGLVISPMQMTSSYFSSLLPAKWFDLLLNKLLFIAILLCLKSEAKKVEVLTDRYDESVLRVRIVTPMAEFRPGDELLLFNKGYGALAERTHLSLASGLEGVLAQQISQQIGIQLTTVFNTDRKDLTISLFIQKSKMNSFS